MMGYVLTLLAGIAIGYVAAYFQHNPERRAELVALFKKKDAP